MNRVLRFALIFAVVAAALTAFPMPAPGPEIDGAITASAIALLAGALLTAPGKRER